nr:MAG TPA: tail protein [Caudoviricetes sp.]
MDYPVTGVLFDELKHGSIIFAPTNDSGTPQPFRVCEISTPLSGVVTIRAKHISYQLSHVPVSPFTAGSCTAALQGIKSHAAEQCPFDFWTDKESTADFSVEAPTSARSLLGGVTGSVLDVYGGEYEFDRYTVKLHNARGRDSGVVIAYGKNLVDLNQEESIESTITGVYPYYKDTGGNVLELPEKVVSSESAQNFPYPRTVPLDCSQVWQEVPTVEQLRAYATSYVKKEGIGVPSVSLKVSFVPLWQTDEYKAVAPAERLNLCDIATVRFEKLGVNARAKVVQTVYDVLAGRYESVTLGEASTNLADTIVDQDKAISEKPSSSELEAAAANATAWITGNKGGYVVLRKNADGQPYELLIMDKPTIEEAVKVWRFNNSGLGYSSTGYNGTYGLAMTQDGQIVADYITTGTLTANLIRTGVIKSLKDDTFFFDIDTGELKINAKSLQINSKGVYDGETVDSKINESAERIKSEVSKSSKITGGGNLILGSDDWNNAAVDAGGNATSKTGGYTINGETVRVVNKAQNTRFRFAADTSMAIVKGVTYCASVLYKLNSGTDRLFLQFETLNGSTRTTYAAAFKENQQDIAMENGWKMRYAVFTATADGYADQLFVSTTADFSIVTCDISLMHPMVQMGNAPTAWTASTGDYLTEKNAKSLISQSADEIKTEVTKSVTETVTANVKDTATSAANDAVDRKLQDYATTATVESLKEDVSSISQKADSISTKVSSLEETTTTISNDLDSTKREFKTVKESVSAIDQKADSITQTVTQRITGGNNIIVGTDNWNNATLDAGGNATSKKGSYTITGESVRVTNKAQNTRFHFGADKTLVIAKGMTYCASVLYKLNSGTDSLFLQFETKNSSGTKSYYGSAFKSAQQDIELDNGWKLRWAAFTATADGYADGLFVSTANDNATVTNDLTIMHPMVQMGNAPTAWTASTGDYLTTAETKTEIKQTVSEIKLTASTSGTSSTIKLTAGGTEITSAQINLSGVVTFSDLSTWNQDKTIINGGNITTGQIHNLSYSTVYDLDNAYIRMGTESGERVFVDNKHIAWYAKINTGGIGLTGVLSSEAGRSYFGASSKCMSYGWVDGLDPSTYVGMQITYNRSDDSDADFNTSRVGVSGTLNCQNLSAWGSKSRVVPTSFGSTKMAAFETPIPMFSDVGFGECGPDGWCLIMPDPRYAETIAQNGRLIWMLTDCTGNGHLWVEDLGQYAIVHGAAGQRFSWMVVSAQRGYEGEYAEPSDCNYPSGTPAGTDYAASEAARASNRDEEVADALLDIDTGADPVIDTLLEENDK